MVPIRPCAWETLAPTADNGDVSRDTSNLQWSVLLSAFRGASYERTIWRLRAARLAHGPGRDRRPHRAIRGDDPRRQSHRCARCLRFPLGLRPLPYRSTPDLADDL